MNLKESAKARGTAALLEEWDVEKNGPMPETADSKRKVWWKCARGHSTYCSIYARVGRGHRCPYCTGQRAIPGETDLATACPEIAGLWDDEANGGLKPTGVTPGSHTKVFWKCEKGHKWSAPPYALVNQGCGCPYCARYKVAPGETDLATEYPELAAQWSPRNQLKPSEVLGGSEQKAWWRCPKGHEYQAMIFSRTSMKTGCPYCAGKKVLAGFNDLATTHPTIARQWYAPLNDKTPEEITAGSHYRAWWECADGHVWQAEVASRTRKKAAGCPVCAGKKVKFSWRYDALIVDQVDGRRTARGAPVGADISMNERTESA